MENTTDTVPTRGRMECVSKDISKTAVSTVTGGWRTQTEVADDPEAKGFSKETVWLVEKYPLMP